MKIADVLPREFVEYMGRCEDQTVIRKFSGKTLLKIAGIESPDRQRHVISNMTEKVESRYAFNHT